MNPTATNAMPVANGKARVILVWVLCALAALAFLAAGFAKLTGAPAMVATFEKIGVGQWFRYVTGLLEVTGAIALLIPRSSFYGAVLLAMVMVGAIISHLTILGGNPAAPIVLLIITATIAWLRKP
jgi:putative oxidoreductase